MTLAVFTFYLIGMLLAVALAVGLAHRKRRIWLLWGIMCLFFPPMVIVLLLLPKREGIPPYERASNGPGDRDINDGFFIF